jgi:P4 family phage/plasmid primase-like protien
MKQSNSIINTKINIKRTHNFKDLFPPKSDAPLSEWAQYYTGPCRFSITPIRPKTKEPYLNGWQNHPITDPMEAAVHWEQHPDDGIGLVLGLSGLATLDIDQPTFIKVALKAVGIDFDTLLKDPQMVWVIGKNPKALFRLPDGCESDLDKKVLRWPSKEPTGKDEVIFELRSGPNQDVLPPSIHPNSSCYQWRNPPWENGDIPVVPPELLDLWQNWSDQVEIMKAACPWQEDPPAEIQQAARSYISRSVSSSQGDQVRDQIRREKSVEDLLADMGAVPQGNNRYLCPFHPEQHPSFWTWNTEGGHHALWCCAHGDAPVGHSTPNGYTVGDVIDLYRFHHRLTSHSDAIQELAHELNIPAGTVLPSSDDPHLTDMGNAERLVERHGEDLRFCPTWKCWLVWDGIRWKKDATHEVTRRAKETVRSIYVEAAETEEDGLRQQLVKHARRSEFRNRLDAMLHLAISEKSIPILPEELDTDIWSLNCPNGTLDLQTGQLRPAIRDEYITKQINVPFDAAAACPQWNEFIEQIMDGDAQRVGYLQKILGYALTGDTSEQCLFMLIGTGANGKSVLLETVQGILGDDYGKSTPTETIMSKERQSIPNDLARLTGTRLVTVNEVDEGRRMSESLVKQMTGGDTITARFLHGEFFDFTPQFKLFIRANHKPTIYGTDHAIWRRIRIIPFDVTIPPEERDPHLKEKLKEEGAGILAWMVEGCQQWHQEGLGHADAADQATQEYRQEMDVVARFLDDCTEREEDSYEMARTLYQGFKMWSEINGERNNISNTEFGKKLMDNGLHKGRNNQGNFYKNIKIIPGCLRSNSF